MWATHLKFPWLVSQTAWAWQNTASTTAQGTVCRSQNLPVKPLWQEFGLQPPSDSGRFSHCPWMQGQSADKQTTHLNWGRAIRLKTVKLLRTYFCHSLVHICPRRSNNDSESLWSLVHIHTCHFLIDHRNTRIANKNIQTKFIYCTCTTHAQRSNFVNSVLDVGNH